MFRNESFHDGRYREVVAATNISDEPMEWVSNAADDQIIPSVEVAPNETIYLAVSDMPGPVGTFPIPLGPNPEQALQLPLMVIHRILVPVVDASSLDEAMSRYDATIQDLQAKIENMRKAQQQKQQNQVVAASESDLNAINEVLADA